MLRLLHCSMHYCWYTSIPYTRYNDAANTISLRMHMDAAYESESSYRKGNVLYVQTLICMYVAKRCVL